MPVRIRPLAPINLTKLNEGVIMYFMGKPLKVGDELYSRLSGWTCVAMFNSTSTLFCIKSREGIMYTSDGKMIDADFNITKEQMLFLEDPNKPIQQPEVKLVKKYTHVYKPVAFSNELTTTVEKHPALARNIINCKEYVGYITDTEELLPEDVCGPLIKAERKEVVKYKWKYKRPYRNNGYIEWEVISSNEKYATANDVCLGVGTPMHNILEKIISSAEVFYE